MIPLLVLPCRSVLRLKSPTSMVVWGGVVVWFYEFGLGFRELSVCLLDVMAYICLRW